MAAVLSASPWRLGFFKKNLSLASLSFTVAITQPCQDTLGKAVWTSLRVGVRQLQGSLSNPSTVKPKSWEAATDVLKDLEPLFLRKSFVVISLHLDQQALVATSHHCFTFRPDGSVYVPHFCRTLGPEACSLGTPLDIRFEERVAKCVASKPTAWSPTESADDVACGAGKVEEWQFWLVHSASWRCTCAMDAAVFFGHDFCHVHHLVAELFPKCSESKCAHFQEKQTFFLAQFH